MVDSSCLPAIIAKIPDGGVDLCEWPERPGDAPADYFSGNDSNGAVAVTEQPDDDGAAGARMTSWHLMRVDRRAVGRPLRSRRSVTLAILEQIC